MASQDLSRGTGYRQSLVGMFSLQPGQDLARTPVAMSAANGQNGFLNL
jgi:hypothetical protein